MFDTKVALIVRDDLATWQKLNVVAFLATGIAAAAPEAIGEPYIDAADVHYGRMLIQPMMIYGSGGDALRKVRQKALDREITIVPYVDAMFSTGNDEENRRVFREERVESMNLVGLAIRGPRNAVDKVVKGLLLHP
ncbi:DUF2000 domain-containing protein [Luteibacter aegosomatissinici]|uniref:DUF2000 domain-containing protein n=1 Tax=Luteibacter aegosomatissinici TaxID=2911539 RepID=UPI001FF922C2|nr:DUF2000 domain-containing protein [Luteibacter aegosomatissinici]UPG92610.1 DUF2000 domain-containing protein [Luteibacter aegosomatissinici]